MFSKFRLFFSKKKEDAPELNERLKKLEGIIGLTIDDPSLFLRALRHRSILANEEYEIYDSYERLEFLGDAVLDLIAAEILFKKYPKKDEGFLTKIRAKLVRGETLSIFSKDLGLEKLMELGEKSANVILSKSILADVFESIIAAIYITYGYEQAYGFVNRIFDTYIDFDDLVHTVDNHKSALLEYTQAQKLPLPRYELVSEFGPGHNRTFKVKVMVGNRELGIGEGKSKKKAEQVAAELALKALL